MNNPVYHFLLTKILEKIFDSQHLFLTKINWEIDNSKIEIDDGKSYPADIENYELVTTEITYFYEHEHLFEHLQGTIEWDLKDLQNIRIVNLDNEIRDKLHKFMQDLEKNIK